MRIIIIPDWPEFWAVVIGIVVVLVIGVVIYQAFWPPASRKLLADDRYQQALSIYAGLLEHEDPTREERQNALAQSAEYLTTEHGIPEAEARSNVRLVVAEHDRDRSYEVRQQAIGYEELGLYDMALDYYQRAARWQEEHDPKDYHFLLGCAARVRAKLRRKE
jgi:tetratricopeptide (TPR) repeat protein